MGMGTGTGTGTTIMGMGIPGMGIPGMGPAIAGAERNVPVGGTGSAGIAGRRRRD